jgi:hypothetical protein
MGRAARQGSDDTFLPRPLNARNLECDVLVAGGGIAGVVCGLAAARLGARVVLCQNRPVLGGNASSEIRMHIVGATGLGGGQALETELREGGIIEEIRLELAVHNPQRSPSMMDLLLYDKCRREPNLTLLLNTTVVGATVKAGVVQSVQAENQGAEARFRISARVFVDCTGDGRLGVEAGAPFMQGREGREDFGEQLAPAKGDRHTLGSSLLLQARQHDRPMPFVAPPWARRFTPEDFRLRPFGQPGLDLGLEYGFWWVEWGGCLDTIQDNERIRDELLAIVLGVWHHIKNESGMDAARWALEWVGFVPGKRESRRFVGQHVLCERDLRTSRAFADAIAYGGWPMDLHPPAGMDAPELPPCAQHTLPFLYDIPLRSCVSAELTNLLFAGRNLSATHVAFSSARVMATCAVVGQGVGTAAALAVREGVQPADLAARPELVRRIQQQLLKDDCYLIGVRNEDAADLTRAATAITASSAQPEAGPEWVRSGQSRSVHGKSRQGADDEPRQVPGEPGGPSQTSAICAPPDRAVPGLHRWMSDPARGFPAWLEIRWDRPVSIREVILIFDTGLHRLLTLSQADGYTSKMLWGRPQPETVRDYRLELETASGWREIARAEENYQRRRAHRLEAPVEAGALRITVSATNGLDHARVCEVRTYSS